MAATSSTGVAPTRVGVKPRGTVRLECTVSHVMRGRAKAVPHSYKNEEP